MLIPVYKDLEGNLYAGCQSFQREPVGHLDIVDQIPWPDIESRRNDAWIYVSIRYKYEEEYVKFIAKMSSKTLFEAVMNNLIYRDTARNKMFIEADMHFALSYGNEWTLELPEGDI